jgi:phage terminase Nu1 subunit (DNA packaging protein)
MTKKTAPKRRADGTLTALCETLNLSKRRVSELLQNGMPSDPQGAVEWRNSKENDDSAAELRRRRIALLREQERLARIKANEADGLLIPRAEVERQHVAIAMAIQAFLRRWEREIPALCLGLSLSQSMPLVKARTRELQNLLADLESSFWKNLPDEKP